MQLYTGRSFEYPPVPRETAAVSWHVLPTSSNHAPVSSVTLFEATYIRCGVFSCNLPLPLLAEWPGYFTGYCGNTGAEANIEIREQNVDPGEEKSRRACRESNPGLFVHESGALTTELSPLPAIIISL